jgi:hypothetical protein
VYYERDIGVSTLDILASNSEESPLQNLCVSVGRPGVVSHKGHLSGWENSLEMDVK